MRMQTVLVHCTGMVGFVQEQVLQSQEEEEDDD